MIAIHLGHTYSKYFELKYYSNLGTNGRYFSHLPTSILHEKTHLFLSYSLCITWGNQNDFF